MRLEQRKILITGGGSGIGLALAQALASTNDVVIAGRDVQKLERARASLPALQTLRLDVTLESAAQAAVAWMVNRLRGIDLLVNSAGVLHGQAFESEADSAMSEEVAVNLLGSMKMTQVALPFLRQSDDGAVVFLSSGLALGASPGAAVYAATKAAIHSLARSLRTELRYKVKVFKRPAPMGRHRTRPRPRADQDAGRARGRGNRARPPSGPIRRIRRSN